MAQKTALAIRHLLFEDLGTFAPVLEETGHTLRTLDIGRDPLSAFDPLKPDLVVVLGGPIGVYETETYPFLAHELELIRARLAANRPTLGICLGAQMMAAAMGARVAPSGVKEIGFSPLTLGPAGEQSPLRHLAAIPVLHWHGDMFDIPAGAQLLAATDKCPHQAFAHGPNLLALQFHPEAVSETGIEPWLIGHTVELGAAGIDPRALRHDAERLGPALREAARAMLLEWLDQLVP